MRARSWQEPLHVFRLLTTGIGCCNLLASALLTVPGGERSDGLPPGGERSDGLPPGGERNDGLPDWWRNITGNPPDDPNVECSHRKPDGCRVLVFGDSWGSLGPGYHMIEEIFAKHGIPVTVKSAAISGTRACQWARKEDSLSKAAYKLFGTKKIDFVWYTLGGNDLLMPNAFDEEEVCNHGVATWDEALGCLREKNDRIVACNEKLLKHFWKIHPHSKVVQCGYDSTCAAEACITGANMRSSNYCGGNNSCIIDFFKSWQPLLLSPLEKYNTDPNNPVYTGINIMGTMQQLSGVPGASTGHPIVFGDAPNCGFFETCIHPMADSVATDKIGDAFWDLFFKKWVTPTMEPYLPPQHDVHIPRRGMFDDELSQTRCLWDWTPSIESPVLPRGCMIQDLTIDGAAWPPVA